MRNSLDVDKFGKGSVLLPSQLLKNPFSDYLARDSHCLGLKGFHDSHRLISMARVVNDEICYPAKHACICSRHYEIEVLKQCLQLVYTSCFILGILFIRQVCVIVQRFLSFYQLTVVYSHKVSNAIEFMITVLLDTIAFCVFLFAFRMRL